MTLHAQNQHALVDAELAELEALRADQLASLPDAGTDTVALAYRGSVERILGEVRAARRRLVEGTYGDCTGCGAAIAPERLELRPWAATCPRCATPA